MNKQYFTGSYPLISHKVMKSDCTSLIGIIINKGNNWKFIPKYDISKYEYDNALVSSNGRLHIKKRYEYGFIGDTFTRANGKIIIEDEWIELSKMTSPDFKSLIDNLNYIRRKM